MQLQDHVGEQSIHFSFPSEDNNDSGKLNETPPYVVQPEDVSSVLSVLAARLQGSMSFPSFGPRQYATDLLSSCFYKLLLKATTLPSGQLQFKTFQEISSCFCGN